MVVFTAGYVIGTFTYFVLRLAFQCKSQYWGGPRFHEVALSDEALANVWEILGAPGKSNRAQELYAGAAFDYGVLSVKHEGIHRWLFRRWNAFSIAATSFWGLFLSFPFGYAVGIPLLFRWLFPVAVFQVILVVVMRWAWHDAMNMAGFMANRLAKDNKPKDTLQNS